MIALGELSRPQNLLKILYPDFFGGVGEIRGGVKVLYRPCCPPLNRFSNLLILVVTIFQLMFLLFQ